MTAPHELNTTTIYTHWDVDPEDLPGLFACADDQAIPLCFELTIDDNRFDIDTPGFCFIQQGRHMELRGDGVLLRFDLDAWLQARVVGHMVSSVRHLELELRDESRDRIVELRLRGPAPGAHHGALIWRRLLEAMSPLDRDPEVLKEPLPLLHSA